jgi:hypothetical protein
MWRGHENALKMYKNHGMKLAEGKGITYVKLLREAIDPSTNMDNPPLVGNKDFHMSHLANLKRKAIADASKGRNELRNNMIKVLGETIFNEIDETLPYIWS